MFYGNTQRSLLNGFSELNTEKLQAMVRFLIIKEGGSVCPTKLNKEMFYADFLHFRRHGKSISGLQYRSIQYSPVPEHYDTIYDNVDGVTKESVVTYDNESIRLHCVNTSKNTPFEKDELETLNAVSSMLRPMKTSEVVELSHQEDAWRNHETNHSFIPYSEAFELKAMA